MAKGSSRWIDDVENAIRAWRIGRRPSWNERHYREDLLAELKNGFAQERVHGSRRVGPRRTDLYLVRRVGRGVDVFDSYDEGSVALSRSDEAIVVEMKLDLRSGAEMRRLKGQVRDYLNNRDEVHRLVVLLLGLTDPTHRECIVQMSEESRENGERYRNSRRMRMIERTF